MKTYQSHKRVKAAHITAISAQEPDGADIALDDGTTMRLSPEMTSRYFPQVGDYLVQYEDGYRSISPKKAFEDGYMMVYAGIED